MDPIYYCHISHPLILSSNILRAQPGDWKQNRNERGRRALTRKTLLHLIEAYLTIAQTARVQHRSRLGIIVMCKAMRTMHAEGATMSASRSNTVVKPDSANIDEYLQSAEKKSSLRRAHWPHHLTDLWMRCRIELIQCQLCEPRIPVRLKNMFEISVPEEPALEDNIQTGLEEAANCGEIRFYIKMNVLASKATARSSSSLTEEMKYLQIVDFLSLIALYKQADNLEHLWYRSSVVNEDEMFIALRLHDFAMLELCQSTTSNTEERIQKQIEKLLSLRNNIVNNLPFVFQRCLWSGIDDDATVGSTVQWQPNNFPMWSGLMQIQIRIAIALIRLAYDKEVTTITNNQMKNTEQIG
ncbi:unnamed protein product [Echinostoma caproni]|uniref:Fungal_trans domain-containing protein n=1 Tax=Echinostoma caproni TaxID=27848 RepID=A0A183A9P8_9TREM|nr:unnamed protein product [Echinostoma caproni]